MTAIHKAKLFRNGASQAVRLPAEFRFDSEEVFISRDPTTGDVTLSVRPGALAWRKFFNLAAAAGDPDDYMDARPLNAPPGEGGIFRPRALLMLHLLDTDTASYIIKRRSEKLIERLLALDPGDVAISVVTRAELVYGLKRIDPAHRLHALVDEFLDTIQILPWTAAAADHYAEIRHQLTSEGQPIGDMDMMIAGHALALRATLVTNNQRHFSRIAAPLLLDNWLD